MVKAEITIGTCYGDAIIPVEVVEKARDLEQSGYARSMDWSHLPRTATVALIRTALRWFISLT